MHGKVRVYSNAVSAGVITGNDGKEYPFSKPDWLILGETGDNTKVVFKNGPNRTLQIKTV